MELQTIYKVISGSPLEVEHILNVLAEDAWRPVTMSCVGQPVILTVILENKIMEESKISLSNTMVETPSDQTEEIQ